MKLRELVRLSYTNTWRRKMRSFLTIWGMSIGIGAMVLLISFASGLQQETRKSFLSATSLTDISVMKVKPGSGNFVGGSGSDSLFQEADLKKLQAIPNVSLVYTPIYLPSVKIVYKNSSVTASPEVVVVERIGDSYTKKLTQGSFWEKNSDHSIVLSENIVEQLKLDSASVLGKEISVAVIMYDQKGETVGKAERAIVTGVTKNTNSGGFAGSFGQDAIAYDLAKILNKSMDVGNPPTNFESSTVNVIVDDAKNVATVAKAIKDLEWTPQTAEDMLKQIDQGFLIMKVILGVMGGIALFVALIGIANSMLMAILERTREIGILVAVGASRRTVNAIFLTEAAWIGAFGGAAGLLGAFLLGKIITFAITGYYGSQIQSGSLPSISFSIDAGLFIATIIGSIIFTLIAAWLPAQRAAKLNPIQALRHE